MISYFLREKPEFNTFFRVCHYGWWQLDFVLSTENFSDMENPLLPPPIVAFGGSA